MTIMRSLQDGRAKWDKMMNKTSKIDYESLQKRAVLDGIKKHAVCAVIFKDDQILLIKRSNEDKFRGGVWEIPGGKVEPNENFKDAVIRETKEETNLDVSSIEKYVGHVDYPVKEIKVRLFMFVANAKDTGVKLIPREHQEYKWVTVDKLEEYLSKEEFTDLLLSYLKVRE